MRASRAKAAQLYRMAAASDDEAVAKAAEDAAQRLERTPIA